MTKDIPLEGDWWVVGTDEDWDIVLIIAAYQFTEKYYVFYPNAPKTEMLDRHELVKYVGDCEDTTCRQAYERSLEQ